MVESFYRRPLPPPSVAFSSAAGRRLFEMAMREGGTSAYWRLSEQFLTQSEPAFCGLSSLIMSCNALGIDPLRRWKGVWRWYAEEMLDCCLNQSIVRQRGVDFDDMVRIARCQGADVVARRGDLPHGTGLSAEEFRTVVKQCCAYSIDDDSIGFNSSSFRNVLICNYSRKYMNQTGDGHYSPIGAYCEKEDMILIMDVARFKLPPHWVPLPLMVEAMRAVDVSFGRSRGYIVVGLGVPGQLRLFNFACKGFLAIRDDSKSKQCFECESNCSVELGTTDVGTMNISTLSKMCSTTLVPVSCLLPQFLKNFLWTPINLCIGWRIIRKRISLLLNNLRKSESFAPFLKMFVEKPMSELNFSADEYIVITQMLSDSNLFPLLDVLPLSESTNDNSDLNNIVSQNENILGMKSCELFLILATAPVSFTMAFDTHDEAAHLKTLWEKEISESHSPMDKILLRSLTSLCPEDWISVEDETMCLRSLAVRTIVFDLRSALFLVETLMARHGNIPNCCSDIMKIAPFCAEDIS